MAVMEINNNRSLRRLRKESGGRGWMRDYLQELSPDIIVYFDDFIGDAFLANQDAVLTDSACTWTKVEDALGGTATLTSDTDNTDNSYAGINLTGAEWLGDNDAMFEVRLQIDDTTPVKIEIGFTDSKADAGAVNSLASNTFTATDCALWIKDFEDGGNTEAFQGVATRTTSGAITKIEDSAIPTIDAATYYTFRVQLRQDFAQWSIDNADGNRIYESVWVADAQQGGNALFPWLFVRNRDGTDDHTLTVDYFLVKQFRVAQPADTPT